MRACFLGFCLLLVGILFALAEPASAGGMNGGWVDDTNINAGVGNTNNTGGSGPSGGSSSAPVCTYSVLAGEDADSAERFSQTQMGPTKGAEPGAWYRQICIDSNGSSTGLIVWRQRAVDPTVVARTALSSARLDPPSLLMNPLPDRVQIVGLPTWLSVGVNNWKSVSATASEGGVTATTTATPVRVIWDTGDGNTTTCNGPGATYDATRPDSEQRSDCTYTYRNSSSTKPGGRYQLIATEEWHVTWIATGVPAGTPATGDLGIVRRTATAPIRVGEIQTLNEKG